MQSFLPTQSDRRKTFLRLAGEIETQLRDAYDRRFRSGQETQSSIARKLGINRSAVHHRLMGHTNMRIETIADMVWALGCTINVTISDASAHVNHAIGVSEPSFAHIIEYSLPEAAKGQVFRQINQTGSNVNTTALLQAQ